MAISATADELDTVGIATLSRHFVEKSEYLGMYFQLFMGWITHT